MKVFVVSTSYTGDGADFIDSIWADEASARAACEKLEIWPSPSVREWEVQGAAPVDESGGAR